MNKAIEAVNIIAPEHLEICVDDPFAVLNSVQNAGSIFLGKNVPEGTGRLLCRPEPHAAHQRHGAVLEARWASMIL